MQQRWIRVVLVVLALVLGGVILGLSFWRESREVIENNLSPDGRDVPVLQHAIDSLEVNALLEHYPLPNPGILPGTPLYPLKMVFERIALVWPKSTQDQSRLLVHYGDKRLAAGIALLEEGRADLTIEVMTKAVRYIMRAYGVSQTIEHEADKKRMYESLLQSTQTYDQLLSLLREAVSDTAKGRLSDLIEEMERMSDSLREALGETE